MSDRRAPACGRALLAGVQRRRECGAHGTPHLPPAAWGWGMGPWEGVSQASCDQCPPPTPLQLTLLVVQVSILYYGGHLVISGQMTSGNLISFIIYEFVLGDCMEVRGRLGAGGAGGRRGLCDLGEAP